MAVNGVLDLASWDLTQDGSLNLNGEWAFYWQQLLGPDDFASAGRPAPTGFFTFPGCWNKYLVDGKPLGGDGFATFRLKVRMTPNDSLKAVRILNQATAYKLWINGKPVANNGVVGKNPETVTPQFLLQEKYFHEKGPVLDIILQVANYNHRKGGVWSPILFGLADQIQTRHNLQWIFDLLLFGSLLIMGVYHLGLFSLRKEDPSSFFFAIITLVFAVRVLVSGDYYLTLVLPDINWGLVYKLELLSVMISPPMLLLFVSSIFNRQKNIKLIYISLGLGALFSLATLIVPARTASHLAMPNQVAILLNFGFMLYILVRALRQKEKGARIVLAGIAMVGFTVVIDILNANQLLHTIDLTPFGIFCLIFSQSYVLSSRFAGAFKGIKKLSKKLEQKNIALQRMDQIKDEFLANTSHELRTPLSGIIGIAESMLAGAAGKMPGLAKNNLTMVVSSGRRLATLVNDLLDFSRLKNKDLALNSEAVDLRTLVDVVLMVLTPLADAKGLSLIQAIPDHIPSALGDENRLQQIFYNLIGNAIKFTEQGNVTVSATAGNPQIEVAIIDTGMGIPTDKLDDIFLSFEQVDSNAARKFGGTGLGLPITKHLVELHGGAIRVETNINQGTTFFFTLPIAKADMKPATPILSKIIDPGFLDDPQSAPSVVNGEPRQGNCQSGYSVLVVDDDPINLQVAINHLMVAGHGVRTATSGTQALEIINSNEKQDLVLLDIMMPGMTGYEVCQTLRKHHTASDLPVVMLTARNRVSDLVKGFETGANDYLTKPFSREELLSRVNAQLQLKEAFQTLAENVRLKKELAHRRETEHHLLIMQRRLSELLDTVDDAVFAVNESGEITFSNRACLKLLGYTPKALLGRSIWSIFGPEAINALHPILSNRKSRSGDTSVQDVIFKGVDETTVSANILITTLELEDERLSVFLIRKSAHAFNTGSNSPVTVPTLTLITELNKNQDRLRSLEETLNATLPKIAEQAPSVQQEIKSIDTALEAVSRTLLSPEKQETRNHLAILVMNLSIDYWVEATHTEKFALARQSGLWKVYTNQDGWERTQTLDKYLDIATLPKRPRWKLVLATADFVLIFCNNPSPRRDHLETALAELRLAWR
ncbi:MAG: response regulator [Desulfobacteraceae bacterium]|nr:response regulator [Desulfobacteraceae bacterium]